MDSSEVKKALSARASAKGVFTRRYNSLTRLLLEPVQDRRESYEEHLDQLNSAKDRFDTVHEQTVQVLLNAELPCEEYELSAIELDTQYTDILGRAKEWLKGLDVATSSPRPSGSTSDLSARLEQQKKDHEKLTSSLVEQLTAVTKELEQLRLAQGQNLPGSSTPLVGGKRALFPAGGASSSLGAGVSHIDRLPPIVEGVTGSEHNSFGDIDERPGSSAPQVGTGGLINTADRGYGRGRCRGRGSANRVEREPIVGLFGTTRGVPTSSSSSDDNYSLLQQQLFQQSALQHQSMMASVHAPRVQLEKFDGNPLRYTAFIQTFTDLVDNVLYNERTKLMILINHCTDKAHHVVSSCQHLDAREGLRVALDKLKNKFGTPYRIRQAWIERILGYPSLSSGELLETFVYELECCYHSLKAIGQTVELECTNTLQLLVAKLPIYLRTKWRKSYRMARQQGDSSPIELLIGLVRDAADDATDPAYGESTISRVRSTYMGSVNPGVRQTRFSSQTVRRGGGAYATDCRDTDRSEVLDDYEEAEIFATSRSPPACSMCHSTAHFTSRCHKFRGLSPSERLRVVRDRKLCHLCLAEGHRVQDCPLPWKCQEQECGRQHHTSLHRAFGEITEGQSTVAGLDTIESDASSESCNHLATQTSESSQTVLLTASSPCLPLTPIVVRNGDRTHVSYALLDSGSTMTLCTRTVMDALGLESCGKRKMNVNTVVGESVVYGDVVNMEMASEHGTEFYPVKGVVAIPTLPISLEHLARGSTIKRWEHLKDVNIPLGSADKVDILVGQNNAHLLEHMEKVTGRLFEPFAVLTRVGWTIFGNLTEDEFCRQSCNFTLGTNLMDSESMGVLERGLYEGEDRVSPKTPVEQENDTAPAMTSDSVELDTVPDLCDSESICSDCSTCSDGSVDDGWSDPFGAFIPPSDEAASVPDQSAYFSNFGCGLEFADDRGPILPCCTVEESDVVIPGSLLERLERFWEMENVPEASPVSDEDAYVLELWDREYRLVDGHVELPIPFRSNASQLKNNYRVAVKSLIALGKRLLPHPERLKRYCTAVFEYLTMGYAEPVPEEELESDDLVFYLLHHGVDHARKPDVTRVVTNGSAKYLGLSLNSVTYKGPDLMNGLYEVLCRFRQFQYASVADIKGMFNQVKVPIKQRNAQRFVFWKDGDPSKEIVVYRMTGHIFGTGWAPAAANYALKRLARDAAPEVGPLVASSVLDEFYVDDWLNGETSEDNAVAMVRDVRTLVKKGSFDLGKVMSNSRKVIASVELTGRAKELATLDLSTEHLPPGVTLGQLWGPELDQFGYRFTPEPKPFTRRGMMSCVASLYDPLGFLVPFILPAKILLQQICRAGSAWDEEIPEDVGAQWRRWLEELPKVNKFKLARWLGCSRTTINRLHHFGDACQRSYGAVSYMVVYEPKDDTRKSLIISAKSKLAPTRHQTIPRLELGAATLAVKMELALKKCFSVVLQPSRFYSDSDIVLKMLLHAAIEFEPFVRNRVDFIHEHTTTDQWAHIQGALNPADVASRGCTMTELLDDKLWMYGPDVIRQADAVCLGQIELDDLPDDFVEFRKVKPVFAANGTVAPPSSESADLSCTEGVGPQLSLSGLAGHSGEAHAVCEQPAERLDNTRGSASVMHTHTMLTRTRRRKMTENAAQSGKKARVELGIKRPREEDDEESSVKRPAVDNSGDGERNCAQPDVDEETRPAVRVKRSRDEDEAEVGRCSKRNRVGTPAVGGTDDGSRVRDEPMVRLLRRYSDLNRVFRSVAWLLRTQDGLRSGTWRVGDLTVEEVRRAERATAYINQKFFLPRELLLSRRLGKLNPIQIGEVWVVGGRCQYTDVDDCVKFPVIVPEDSPLARLIVSAAHREVGHSGTDRTLLEVRQGYWLLGGRREVKRLLSECILCRRHKAGVEGQKMGPVPMSRVQINKPPFAHSGVDLFGPISVCVRRSQAKRYGVLFTCLTCRAIHLEVAEDLSTSAFLCCLERFSARRGRPERLQSDNGTNFVGGKAEVQRCQDVLTDPSLTRHMVDKRIEWSMNTPSASHQGGIWERMIRTVRSLLVVMLNEHPLTDDRLHTTLCIIEGVVNNRPLTRINDDPESDVPLTPAHLLNLHCSAPMFPERFSSEGLRRDWRQAQFLADSFWKKWLMMYFPLLQRRTKWDRAKRNLTVGELVLIVQDNLPRGMWRLGVIEEVFPGRDGLVRNALVRCSNGQFRRPVQKLVRLEGDLG